MGHNICLDFFGVPSKEELDKGITTHGEAPILKWTLTDEEGVLAGKVNLPEAGLDFERRIEMNDGSNIIRITEEVTNLKDVSHQFSWCQHVTFGEPFLQKGETLFDMPAVWGRTFTADFGSRLRLEPERDFIWPTAPGSDGSNRNLRYMPSEDRSGDFSTQMMDPALETAWFTAYTPEHELLAGYAWKRSDFPWIGNWEENFARDETPWNGKELTRGMEFSTSPFPSGRKDAVEMKRLNKTPTFRTAEPGETVTVSYAAFLEKGVTGFSGADALAFDGDKVLITTQKKEIEIT
jgi:hypothetical protein